VGGGPCHAGGDAPKKPNSNKTKNVSPKEIIKEKLKRKKNGQKVVKGCKTTLYKKDIDCPATRKK